MNNVYNSVTVSPNTPTIIASLTVPARGGYSLKGFIAWGDCDAEWSLKKNVDIVGGGRTSSAERNLFVNFASSPEGLLAGDICTVLATHMEATPQILRCTLLVEQL